MSYPTLKASQITPYKTRILVKKYTKPKKIGSILINPAWRVDNSRALWEVVKAGKAAEEYLGLELPPNTILITLPNRGSFAPLDEKIEHYFLFAEEIVKIISWRDDEVE